MRAAMIVLCAVASLGLLAAERAQSRTGIWIAKPVAATAFVFAAALAGATETTYGRWVLAGLFLSWWGDVLLIPKSSKSFLLGLVAFLLGHVAYAAAFWFRGVAPTAFAISIAVLVPVLVLVDRWLSPHVGPKMKHPVRAYMFVITVMLALSVGCVAQSGWGPGRADQGGLGPWAIAVGAAMFYVSDLAVARNRFVRPGFSNKVWGIPLYFGAQLVLGATV